VHSAAALTRREGSALRGSVAVCAEEWGFAFHHTDIPFVHGRDDFGFIRQPHTLPTRSTAAVRSNVTGATAAVRRWLHATRLER
jgi:hypothetical protein